MATICRDYNDGSLLHLRPGLCRTSGSAERLVESKALETSFATKRVGLLRGIEYYVSLCGFLIWLTWGTTGKPKGVSYSHRSTYLQPGMWMHSQSGPVSEVKRCFQTQLARKHSKETSDAKLIGISAFPLLILRVHTAASWLATRLRGTPWWHPRVINCAWGGLRQEFGDWGKWLGISSSMSIRRLERY